MPAHWGRRWPGAGYDVAWSIAKQIGHALGALLMRRYSSGFINQGFIMRILSLNANGIRSAVRKGFLQWLPAQQADVVCIQETKARETQLDASHQPQGYHAFYRDAITRKGYSGVAIYSKNRPDTVIDTLGWAPFDDEGRYIEARFGPLSVVSIYMPSGSSGEERQRFKFEVMAWLTPILRGWLASGRDYVVCGDFNIVHTRMDIRNWRSNQKNSGCLPEERAWLDELIDEQHWADSFRVLQPDAEAYTWWSNRGQAYAKDVGWRIDYQFATPSLLPALSNAVIHRSPRFSDHAPYVVDYAYPATVEAHS